MRQNRSSEWPIYVHEHSGHVHAHTCTGNVFAQLYTCQSMQQRMYHNKPDQRIRQGHLYNSHCNFYTFIILFNGATTKYITGDL